MEVFIRDERRFALERVDPNDKIVLPDGSTSNGFTRQALLSPSRVTQALLDRLLFVGLPYKVEIGQSIPCLGVSVGLQGTADPGKLISTIQLTCGGQFLQSLYGHESHFLEEAKLQLQVSFLECYSQCYGTRPIQFSPVEKPLLFRPGQGEAKRVEFKSTMDWSMDHLIRDWIEGSWIIFATIKIVPSRTIGDVGVLALQDPLAVIRRMLADEILADTKVLSKNGAEIKFHRSVLAAHSPAFERMFQTKMQEAASGVLELLDMSEESVRALKEYLYVWDLKAAQENSLVCFELFEAGHKYGISTLEESTSDILMKMGGAWYSAMVALRLFLLVKDMELPRLKQKAVEVLKLKREEVMNLDQYHDLFKKENVSVAKELTGYLLASP